MGHTLILPQSSGHGPTGGVLYKGYKGHRRNFFNEQQRSRDFKRSRIPSLHMWQFEKCVSCSRVSFIFLLMTFTLFVDALVSVLCLPVSFWKIAHRSITMCVSNSNVILIHPSIRSFIPWLLFSRGAHWGWGVGGWWPRLPGQYHQPNTIQFNNYLPVISYCPLTHHQSFIHSFTGLFSHWAGLRECAGWQMFRAAEQATKEGTLWFLVASSRLDSCSRGDTWYCSLWKIVAEIDSETMNT